MGYQHGEAFCLMWYVCRDCTHRERIWNSRNGVTPFTTRCVCCTKGFMEHTDFSADQRAVGYELVPGEYFWRDGTPEEARKFVEDRFKALATNGRIVPEDMKASMIAEAENSVGQWEKGWPKLDREPFNPYKGAA